MDILLVSGKGATPVAEAQAACPANGFLWMDVTHDEISTDPEAWRNKVAVITGIAVYDLHLSDILNLAHPSNFDSTNDYALVVFRKLALGQSGMEENGTRGAERKMPPALAQLATIPISFIVRGNALVTIHPANTRIIDSAKAKMLAYQASGNGIGGRPPSSPEELMLRLLNAMVDQYLELRQPLSAQLDRWQRALLNPRRPFEDWMALLDARNELHKLDRLCEEQHDALQELRDHFVDTYDLGADTRERDLLLVRTNDVMEHITRVLNHARRLESSLESAVQIYFASVSHRTSEIMRVLTVITALFMPLTLITGIFGMNFTEMPLLKDKEGFWITMGVMGVVLAIGIFAGLLWKRSMKKAP